MNKQVRFPPELGSCQIAHFRKPSQSNKSAKTTARSSSKTIHLHPKRTQKQQLKNVTEIDYIFVDCKSVMILCTHLFGQIFLSDVQVGTKHLNVKKKKKILCYVMDYSTLYAYKCEIYFQKSEFQVQFNGNSLS